MLELFTVDAARIRQRFVDVVAEGLLESSGSELLTAQLPVGLGSNRVGVGLQAVLGENLVVELPKSVRPRRVALESLARQLIVVDDGDVRMDVLTVRVVVDDHHVLGTKRRTRELTCDVDGTFDVGGLSDVELLGVEREDEIIDLVLASVPTSLSLGVLDECLGRLHRARITCCARRTVCNVLTVLLATPVERVRHRATST